MGGTREEKIARGNEKSQSLKLRESKVFFRQKMDHLTEWPNYNYNVSSHEFKACNKSVPVMQLPI